MKKAERGVYRALADEGNFILCSFCKYADFSSGSCCDCDGDISCNHPLGDRLEDQWGRGWNESIEPGCDCWGFRPRHDVPLIADIVGIVLVEGWNGGVSWWQENGSWRVGGIPFYKKRTSGTTELRQEMPTGDN